jgi:drug/metabolite transporter (DMT)-like permease
MYIPLASAAASAPEALPWLGPLAALGSSLTWAYGSAVYAQSARRVGSIEVNLTRSLLALPLFALAALFTVPRGALGLLSSDRFGWLTLSMLCSYGLGDAVFYLAAVRLGTPTALAIGSSYPVWATLLGALVLGEPVGPGRIAGTLLCIAGVVWLVLLQARAEPAEAPPEGARPRGVLVGVLLAVLVSILWAGNTYSIRRGAQGLPLMLANTIRYGLSVLLLFGLWLRIERRRKKLGSALPPEDRLLARGKNLRRFALTAFIEAFCGSSIFVYGLSHSDLSVAAPLSSLAPLFAVPIGLLLGTERLHLRRIAAIAVTVAGVILLVRP